MTRPNRLDNCLAKTEATAIDYICHCEPAGRGNPVVHGASRRIDGIATGLSALSMTAVDEGWSLCFRRGNHRDIAGDS